MSYSYPLRTPWSVKGAVVLLHMALILALAMASYEKISSTSPKTLVVQTIVLEPKPSTFIEEKAPQVVQEPILEQISIPEPEILPKEEEPSPIPPPEPQKSEPQKKVEKKELPKPAAKKPVKKAPTPAVKKTKPQAPVKKPVKKPMPPSPKRETSKHLAQKKLEEKRASMVSQALSSLNRVEKHAPQKTTSSANLSTPKIGTLSAEAMKSESVSKETKEPSYYGELVQRLKLALKLPEYGEVKIELTLNRSGKVVNLKCIQSKSKKNANYLEKMIPSVTFPPFGHNFVNEKQHTFRLRLSEDILMY